MYYMVTHNTVTINGGGFKNMPTVYFPTAFNQIYFCGINACKAGADGITPTSSTFIILVDYILPSHVYYGLKNNSSGDKAISRSQYIFAIGY